MLRLSRFRMSIYGEVFKYRWLFTSPSNLTRVIKTSSFEAKKEENRRNCGKSRRQTICLIFLSNFHNMLYYTGLQICEADGSIPAASTNLRSLSLYISDSYGRLKIPKPQTSLKRHYSGSNELGVVAFFIYIQGVIGNLVRRLNCPVFSKGLRETGL